MPISVECDQCGKQYRVTDESAGKKMRCRECQAVLTIPSAAKGGGKSAGAVKKPTRPKPIEDDDDYEDYGDSDDDYEDYEDYDDRPSRSRRGSSARKSSKSKSKKSKSVSLSQTQVRTGVLLVYVGFAIFLLTVIWAFIAGFTLRNDFRTMITVGRIIGYLALASNILTTIGKLLCLTAPPQMPGKPIIFLAVFFDMLGLSLGISQQFMVLPMPWRNPQIQSLITIASLVSFVLFLGKLGEFMRDRDIPEIASSVLRLGLAVIALIVMLIGLGFLAAYNFLAPITALIGLVTIIISLFVLSIISVIRYGSLLNRCLSELS